MGRRWQTCGLFLPPRFSIWTPQPTVLILLRCSSDASSRRRCWTRGMLRSAARTKNKAEAKQRTSGMPISLTQGEHVSLRQSFEKAFGRMEDEGFPASGVIERRLQEVEQGNPTGEPLSDRCFFRRGFRPTRGIESWTRMAPSKCAARRRRSLCRTTPRS